MATVTYDDRSFLIDGRRIWLVSGSIDYFRVPRDLWHDRLLKAKRAALNCITTCVAWNCHEGIEGQWDLAGQRDVGAFIRMAGELGLYVILRPGPYIAANWDFGGLPPWLTTKSGMAYRTNNAAFTHYYDKYFRKMLPLLADLQVTRGGNIILIQNEDHYRATTMPDRLSYLEFISQLFRRSGFDIPIITANGFTNPPVPDTVECVKTFSRPIQLLKRMRLRQPNAPLLVIDFCSGKGDRWGKEHEITTVVQAGRLAMEILGCGAQYNYTMWHGGTNFGFAGGRAPETDSSYQTTSYDCDAPLAEGGGLTRKYYTTRLVNMLARYMGRFFASSILEQPGVSIHNATDVLNLTGTLCNWAVIVNNGPQELPAADISLPEGQEFTVPLAPLGAAAVPVELDLTANHVLDYCNLTPLGFFDERLLVLHGPSGWWGRVSINGREIRRKVPKGLEPVVVDHKGILVAFINSDAAMRTWPLEDSLIIGPAYVGEGLEEIVETPRVAKYPILAFDGKVTYHKASGARRRKPTPPKLSQWKRLCVCDEMSSEELSWREIAGPTDVDQLGVHQGYIWYRIEIDQPRAKQRSLFLPDCEDRAGVFLNGKPVGTWGRGDGAIRSPMRAGFKKGRN
ncbi:MAG: beta-galactosidase, partial [Planctomycetes bacterium]|nr:beta-galactosidase [Planctomycetota bacterium]